MCRRLVNPAAKPPRVEVELTNDLLAAFFAVEDHEVLVQPRAIVVERLHFDRATSASAGREEPMAVGDRSTSDVLHERSRGQLGAADFVRHDPAAVQEQQPANRPAERQLALPVLEARIPVHLLREGEASQDSGQHVG